MKNLITILLAISAAACISLITLDNQKHIEKSSISPPPTHIEKSSISPPPTAEELALFRIVSNQFGTLAIQQLEGTNWSTRINRWRDEKQCRWDMEWWIAHTLRTNTQEAQSVWTPKLQSERNTP